MNRKDIMRAKIEGAILRAADNVAAQSPSRPRHRTIAIVALVAGASLGSTSTLGGMYLGMRLTELRSDTPVAEATLGNGTLPEPGYSTVQTPSGFGDAKTLERLYYETALQMLQGQACIPTPERPARGISEFCSDSNKYF